jgi:D-glycero-D-manno-heptose 1,7-bisphosphate phosphatase
MKLVILDRDGTINADSDDFVKSPEEWLPLPGALEAIARLNHAGWHVVVASNQSGLGRGLFDVASLNAMHTKMHKLLAAQWRAGRGGVLLPAHARRRLRHCRKPASRALRPDWRALWRGPERTCPRPVTALRDLQAGAAAGCEPHLVLTGKGAAFRDQPLPDTFPAGTTGSHADLGAFADFR